LSTVTSNEVSILRRFREITSSTVYVAAQGVEIEIDFPLSGYNHRQVVHTRSSVIEQYKLVLAKRR